MRSLKVSSLLSAVFAATAPALAQNGMDINVAGFGAQITTTGSDAIRIVRSADDGIQIGSAPDYPNYGVYIPSPGVSTYGLWPNTANAAGEWALFTVDDIRSGNVVSVGQSLIAYVGEGEALAAGDIVAAGGVGPVEDGAWRAPVAVRRATAADEAVVGVVQSRLDWVEPFGKDGDRAMESAPGPARPGDYVLLTIAGVALTKVAPGAAIAPGQQLAVGEVDGRARPLRTRRIDGFLLSEGVPTIGVALEALRGDADAILVFVATR